LGCILKKVQFFGHNFIITTAVTLHKYLLPFFFFWIIANEKGTDTFGWKVPLIIVSLTLFAYLSGYLIANISKISAKSAFLFIIGCYRFDVCLGLAFIYFLFDGAVVRSFCISLIFLLPIVDIISYLGVKRIIQVNSKEIYDLKEIKHIILNPIIIGGILGWISSEIGLVFPIFINNTAEMIIALIFPLVLIITGGSIHIGSTSSIEKAFVIGTAFKILVLPLLIYLCLIAMGLAPVSFSSVIIFFTIPSFLDSKMAGKLYDPHKYNSFVFFITSIVFFFLNISSWIYILGKTS
jgi:predicted permease